MIAEMIARGWDNFLARPEGTLNLRFIVQPLVASLIAVRAGIADAANGRPAYLWAAFNNAGHRHDLLVSGLKQLWLPILNGTVLDVIYQIITHRWVYPLELVFTVALLVLVPYLLVRGPVNRVARRFGRKRAGAD